MKTLAQYLMEYLHQESDGFVAGFGADIEFDTSLLQGWIEQGIEAYQSAENCTITITEQTQQQKDLVDAAREIVSDFDNYGEVLQTGFQGDYGKDTAIGRLSAAIQQIDNN